MHYFNSTALHAAKYDAATLTLTIWFTSSGRGYDYYNVPPAHLARPHQGRIGGRILQPLHRRPIRGLKLGTAARMRAAVPSPSPRT